MAACILYRLIHQKKNICKVPRHKYTWCLRASHCKTGLRILNKSFLAAFVVTVGKKIDLRQGLWMSLWVSLTLMSFAGSFDSLHCIHRCRKENVGQHWWSNCGKDQGEKTRKCVYNLIWFAMDSKSHALHLYLKTQWYKMETFFFLLHKRGTIARFRKHNDKDNVDRVTIRDSQLCVKTGARKSKRRSKRRHDCIEVKSNTTTLRGKYARSKSIGKTQIQTNLQSL